MSAASTIAAQEKSEFAEPTGLALALGFYFAFRVFLVYFSVHVLGLDARIGAAATLGSGLLLLVLVCFQSLGRARIALRSMLQLASVRWVFLFLGFSCLSLAWSETVSLTASIAYWCGMAADVASVIVLARAGSLTAVSDALIKGFIAGACGIALLAWILPANPTDLRLGDDEFFNTNQIGSVCAFGILLAQYLMRRRKAQFGLASAFLAITLLRSLSKTTLVAFVVAECFLLIQDRSMTRKLKLWLTTATLLAVLSFWGLFEAYYDIYTSAGNQAETFTGRTAIWAYALGAGIEKPWIGHGFDSMWKVVPPFGPDRFEARHAENELLQQFYAYGIAGVVILIGLYESLLRQFRKLAPSPVKTVCLSILLYVVVRGTAEAEPFDLLLPLWLIVVLGLLAE
jgi:exopolysaccharide production protein ExoQ